ncbi:hypothetical protein J6590_058632 [Homalodisca vitripennis]|nr:hypothetical protein J6590_058632 [Homalodisca vitripennis]
MKLGTLFYRAITTTVDKRSDNSACFLQAWSRALRLKIVRKRLDRLQRKVGLGVCSGYRTISTEADLVMAGISPMELLARERTEVSNGMRKEEAIHETMAGDQQERRVDYKDYPQTAVLGRVWTWSTDSPMSPSF